MRYTILFAILSVGVSAFLRADEASTQSATPQRVTLYAALVKPGPVWRESQKSGQRLDMSRHFAYVMKMREQGKLVMGGPFADGSGGLIVYRAASMDEAKTLVENDPAVIEKVFDPEIHPWSVQAADVMPR